MAQKDIAKSKQSNTGNFVKSKYENMSKHKTVATTL
jgi:hypothetical protein